MLCDSIGVCAWQKNSFVDFPGTVSTVLFFQGCNLRCPWCHNPQIVNGLLPQVSLEEVLAFLDKRKNIIDGVVLSGGEPTLHKSLGSLVHTLHERGLKVKLDTNGLNPDILEKIVFDYIAMDLKTEPAQYNDLGFLHNDCEERLNQSIETVRKMGEFAEIRIPCAPGFINKNIAEAIGILVKGVAKVFLQPLNYKVEFLDESFKGQTGIRNEEIKEYQQIIAPYVGVCNIRGE